jgi:hypothetical protein
MPLGWAGGGRICVRANRDVNGNVENLDAHLKGHLRRRTIDYIVVVLERAGIVELDCDSSAPRASLHIRTGMTRHYGKGHNRPTDGATVIAGSQSPRS